MEIVQLRRRRSELVTHARAILEQAESEDRSMTAEEQERYDRMFDDGQDLADRILRIERLEAAQREIADAPVSTTDPVQDQDGRRQVPTFESRALSALDPNWHMRGEWSQLYQTTDPAYINAWRQYIAGYGETRALQVDLNTAGGYLVAPMQFVDQLIKSVDDMTYIRQWARTFSVPNADALGAPSLENDPADATWTTELGVGDEDSTMSFGRRELRPHPLAKYIKISNTLLRKVATAESLVRDRLAYKFAITMEKGFLTGSGSQQPLGVFTASNDGIGTARDMATDNTTTAITFDGLINAKFHLKQQYWDRSRWLFHRDAVKMISKLVDGNGQYIWRESTRVGEPDRLLGLPVFISEYVPNTFTTGLYVGILGDFTQYWIADALDMSVQRLVELYAATNQVGLVGRMESDGMPVLAEAFTRVTLA